ncbi:MAG: hypothetical protein TR69_WS6001001494 [candidate division WS6 bacterium OLB20]|uniref:Glycosyltransferase RgtA/B/C/D-like domain-containing protein n=1 Tax=candidate division WS6 bacterium OLB20 TaxID=1617426 RepID=A0A136LW59_9BACT|nr:MAG: hypothetical protein TR69_WS6001001494 [candidate division WS6 bacterium OLB20]
MFQKYRVHILVAAALTGIVLRFVAAMHGHNYDFESYLLVADIAEAGRNVYTETSRYNYGPAWFLILLLLRHLSYLFSDPAVAFRLLVVVVLTAADLAIMFYLLRHFGARAAVLFILNPVSILITGYHSQFDNLAIAIGLWAMAVYASGRASLDRKVMTAGLALLGLSLVVKHVLILLPVWLAIREDTFVRKGAALAVPVLILIISFLPFMDAWWDIRANVILYDSAENAPLLLYGLPPFLSFIPLRLWMFGGILLAGFAVKKRPLKEYVLLYSVVLVVFSMSVINHHLAVPMAAVAVWPNIFYVVYTILTTWMLSLDKLGLGIEALINISPPQLLFRHYGAMIFAVPVFILFLGLLKQVASWRKLTRRELPG